MLLSEKEDVRESINKSNEHSKQNKQVFNYTGIKTKLIEVLISLQSAHVFIRTCVQTSIIYNIFVSAYSLMNKYELSLQLGTIMYWAQKKLQIAQ